MTSNQESDIVCLKGGDVKSMTQDTRKRFTFRLPENLYQKLKDKADEQGFSINALMLHVLQEWLKDQMK